MSHYLRHRGRSVIAYLAFGVVFIIVLLIVSDCYLLPTLKTYNNADLRTRKYIATESLLVMSAVLVLLVLAMSLIFRLGRLFFPPPTSPQSKTQYTDAWAESAKRMQPPKE